MGHCFEPSRSLMSWDGKKQKKSSSFNTTDGKSRTKFLRIYVKSHNTCIVTGHKNLVCSYDLKGLLNILNIFLVICKVNTNFYFLSLKVELFVLKSDPRLLKRLVLFALMKAL